MRRELRRSAVITRPTPGQPPTPAAPRPDRFVLDNGLRVVAIPRHGLPQVAARMILPAGSAADPPNAPGTASFVGSLLTEGTEALSAIELNQRIDSLGASLCARAGHDFAEVDLRLLAETLDEGLELFGAVILGAAFPEREVERVRAETLDALDARMDEPSNVADDQTSEAVFGTTHPYGRLPIGTVEGVRRLQRDGLLDFHRTYYRPENSVLVVAGDFHIADLKEGLSRTLGEWSGSAPPSSYPDLPGGPDAQRPLTSIEWDDSPQAEIRVGGLGLQRSSPDWIPAAVANYILGGSTITGRLGANLREDKGWTYGIRSGFAAGIHPGGWTVETAVDAEVASDALNEIEAELRRMVSEPVSEEELSRATEALILSLPRAFETPARIVSRLATIEAYALDKDYWDRLPERVHRVTPEDIQRIARVCFDPDRLVRVTVGPEILR